MNIIDKTKGPTTFGELSLGDVFKYYDMVYMVTEPYTVFNAVLLENGRLYHFAPDDTVTFYKNPTIILE